MAAKGFWLDEAGSAGSPQVTCRLGGRLCKNCGAHPMLLRCVDGERLRLVGLFVAAAAVRVPGASVYGELKEERCVQEICSVVLVLVFEREHSPFAYCRE